MKKLMILGGNPETAVLVKTSRSMGIYTIVVDPNPDAPAKKHASASYDIDGFEVDKIVQLAKDIQVDAVLVGVADILVKPYKEICEKLNMHCYATTEAIEAFCSKDGFKRYCQNYGIQDIPGIYLDKSSSLEKPEGLDYPLMIKPVDSGGGVGMKICRDDADYHQSVKTALQFSKKGMVLVEKYMECDDMAAYYTFKDGVAHISALSDRVTTKKQGDASPVCIGAVYPSKYTDLFVRDMHPKLCELFKGLKIKDGILNIQFFVENNVIYAYDPGFRLQGEAPNVHLAAINGFDHRQMLIDYAFTGVMGEADFAKSNDYRFKGRKACTIWVLLTAGTIGSITGLDALKNDDSVVFVLERFTEGDVVHEEWLGTEKQVYARIYLNAPTISEVNQKILDFKDILKVTDTKGEDMVLDWLAPLNEEDYK